MFNNSVLGFKRGWRGPIYLEVSRLVKDWQSPGMQLSEAQMTKSANTYCKFARLWLEKRGYYPVEIRLVNGYNEKSIGYGYNPDPQSALRLQIMSDYLSPSNWGRQMSEWKGISSNTPNIRYIADNGAKSR